MGLRCPGQDTRFWKPQDIFNVDCPHCGRKVEFFKDDVTRKCPGCGNRIVNPRYDPGCAKWCPYAEVCLAEAARSSRDPKIVREQIEFKLKQLLKEDRESLERALRTASAAEKLVSEERVDALPVIAASLLLDAGKGDKGEEHEREGAEVARELLTDIGLDKATIEEVARLVENHHSPDPDEGTQAVIHDAQRLVEFEYALKELEHQGNEAGGEGDTRAAIVERYRPVLKTSGGKRLIDAWGEA